jgi:photosystem II stability/assembly factor-like uncharacterized protein
MKIIIYVLIIPFMVLSINNTPAQWLSKNGPYGGNVISLCADEEIILAGTLEDVYYATDDNSNWIATGIEYSLTIQIISNYIFVGTYDNGMFYSKDNGLSWNEANEIMGGNQSLDTIPIYTLIRKNDNVYLGTINNQVDGGSLYFTNIESLIWTPLNNGIEGRVYSLATNGNDIFAGTNYSNVFYTINEGQSWIKTHIGNFTDDVQSIVVKGDTIIAGTNSRGAYISTDKGGNWSSIGLEHFGAGLDLDFAEGKLFAAIGYSALDKNGVYYSSDYGNNWYAINEGLPTKKIWSIDIFNDTLYVGTENEGVWYRPISGIINNIGDDIIYLQDHFAVNQNYPNPFNPATKIKYEIPELSFVTLKVYDVLGNEIIILINEDKSVGSYTVEFDATSLPSGIYFYRLQAGDYIETNKMVLMK